MIRRANTWCVNRPAGIPVYATSSGAVVSVSATRLSAQVTVPKQVQMLLQPGSDIWQKEYALELQRRRLTLHDIELELQKEAKRRRRRSVFRLLNPPRHLRCASTQRRETHVGR